METGNLVNAFFNTAGVGGAVVMIIFLAACGIYIKLTRWILAGGQDDG
jgi:hypothetical protein